MSATNSTAGESSPGEFGLWAQRGAALAVGAVLVVGVALLLASVVEVLLLAAIAVLLAIGIEPLIETLHQRFGIGRGTAMLIVFAGVVAVAILLLAIMVPTLLGQLDQVQTQLPELRSNFEAWVNSLQPGLLKDTLTQLVATTGALASEPVEADPEVLLSAGITIAESAFAVMTIVALILFWLTGHHRMERFFFALVPAERRGGVREAWDVVQERLGYWVRGQMILMLSIFVMTTVAYFVLGLPNALLLGVLAGIAELVPIVGPALGAVPALLAAGLMPDPVASALLVGVVYVVIQVFEGNVLVPIVMKNAVGVPPFLVIMSLIIGAAAAGLAGAILAVPLTAALVVILERVQAREVPVQLEVQGQTVADDDDEAEPGTVSTRDAGGAASPSDVTSRTVREPL